MSDFPLLFALWASTCLSLSLVWYIWFQNNSHKEEREGLQQQLQDQLNLMQQERKELYDRIQAGTLPQYKEYAPEPNEVDEQPDETTDLEDARDELQPESIEGQE